MTIPSAAAQDGEDRIHRNCPSCGTMASDAALMSYSHPEWPMRRCPECGLIYLEWVPDYARLYDALAWTKRQKLEVQRRLKAQPILARIDLQTRWRMRLLGEVTQAGGLHYFAQPGPVLDVGCGSGKKFAKLRSGYIPWGIEIESTAAERARAVFEPRGGRVINKDAVSALPQLPENYFTGVTLWSYLEHEAKPRKALEATRKIVRKDGVVLVKVPNFACWNRIVLGANWPGFRHPDHVQYFTPATLARLARATGFEVRYRLYGRIPFNDNMYGVLRPV